jgi:hypothetical protein
MEAVDSEVRDLQIAGALSGMPMVTLPPGVNLRGEP